MEYITIVLFYLFGGFFMFLKIMVDLDDIKEMPEFFVYGAAFTVALYPITYPIIKFIDILEGRKEKKRRKDRRSKGRCLHRFLKLKEELGFKIMTFIERR